VPAAAIEIAAADRLRAAGMRVTSARLAVYAELHGAGHLDADTLATRVGKRLGNVSRQTVYDALRVLSQLGLVRRIEPAGSPAALYETRVADNHHHVVCRSCGDIADVDCVVGEAPCLEPSDAHGFTLDEAEVVFWGTCPSCRANPHTSQPPTPKEKR
jgi:Fur family transcriptional regulator, stress-responsive regulator